MMKSSLQSDVVLAQLDQLKSVKNEDRLLRRGSPILRMSLLVLMTGLTIVTSCVWDQSLTSQRVKWFGPCLVLTGLAFTLWKILLIDKPTCWLR